MVETSIQKAKLRSADCFNKIIQTINYMLDKSYVDTTSYYDHHTMISIVPSR